MDRFLKLRKKLKLDKVKLTYRSLIRMSLYILGLFLVLSVLAERFLPVNSDYHFQVLFLTDYKAAEKQCAEHLTKNPTDADMWRLYVFHRTNAEFTSKKLQAMSPAGSQLIPQKIDFFLNDQEYIDLIKKAEKPTPEALSYLRHLIIQKFRKKTTSAIVFEHTVNLSADRKEELARFYMQERKFTNAVKLFNEILLLQPDNDEIKSLLMKAMFYSDREEFTKMLGDPEWASYADDNSLFRYYLKTGSYFKMLYYLTKSELSHYSLKAVVCCVLAGFCWVIFLTHLGHGWFWSRKEQLMILVAFGLGFLSTHFCLGVVVVQDHLIGFDGNNETKTTVFNFAYCVFGIGLREELCKMLFFMPLLPFLVKVKENYKILVYCSLIGLGFAVEENIGYSMRYANDPVLMGRFLTANFLHMMLTGYICYYLTLAFKRKGKAWDDFTTALVKMIVIHGIYDFFLIDPKMKAEGFYFFSMMIAIYMSMQYIRLLLYSSPPSHHYVSLTRVFTAVLCVAVGLSLFMLSVDAGVKASIKLIFAGMLTNAIFAYMFFREFDERIT
jgi:RsiW-degrading membrane proteinase PrsW (M82 family)